MKVTDNEAELEKAVDKFFESSGEEDPEEKDKIKAFFSDEDDADAGPKKYVEPEVKVGDFYKKDTEEKVSEDDENDAEFWDQCRSIVKTHHKMIEFKKEKEGDPENDESEDIREEIQQEEGVTEIKDPIEKTLHKA
jgi:hypothetical protein